MFYLIDVKEKVGVEAQKIKENIRESIEESLEATHTREENGIFLGVTEIKKVGESGDILPEKPEIYFNVEYTALFFQPVPGEILYGTVVDVAEFGPFVRIGPIDALAHISQITAEKMTYNPQQDVIASKDNKLVIQAGDMAIACVANASISKDRMRVNLTMRADGLGLLKWLSKEKAKKKAEKGEAEGKETKAAKKGK
ncbi:MAG: DNA-directed RNA polymerase [Candidatus Aenigmarchaeota archaeon]|nr:DNA-directed RNA polymerase [Candidatus Aenigmarchaeota archaeon]